MISATSRGFAPRRQNIANDAVPLPQTIVQENHESSKQRHAGRIATHRAYGYEIQTGKNACEFRRRPPGRREVGESCSELYIFMRI